jgi:hypothetical protein
MLGAQGQDNAHPETTLVGLFTFRTAFFDWRNRPNISRTDG